jgi:hemerythrin
MSQTVWTEGMSVGVKVLDEDHKKVFALIDELHEAIVAGHKKEVLEASIGRLMDYSLTHLAREEAFFDESGYPGAAAHRLQHQRMVLRVESLRARMETGPVSMLSLELRNFLQDWWQVHIMGSDQGYGASMKSKGIE